MGKILCVIDGMTDPLFRKEDFDNLSTMHISCYRDTACGDEPETLACVLHLLGVKKVPQHLRGYIEALGADIPVEEDDLILRGSWYQIDTAGRCTVPCDTPTDLCTSNCRYHYLGQYKCLVVVPHMACEIEQITTHFPSSNRLLDATQMEPVGLPPLQVLFRQCLSEDRCMVLWGQSVPVKLAAFPQRAAVVCGKGIVKGIAKALKMDLIDVPGATGDIDTDLKAKVEAAISAAEEYPFVLLHLNGADEASHRRDYRQKYSFLKQVDSIVISRLLQINYEVAVVSDHGTDPQNGGHLRDKQPVFVKQQARGSCFLTNIPTIINPF